MIPNLAAIVAIYAVARLANEYVLTGPKLVQVRLFIGAAASVVIGWLALEIWVAAGDLGGLQGL